MPITSRRVARTGVVLVNFGAPDDTLACLASLERSDDLDLDVIVVDNGPDDERHARLVAAVGARGTVLATGDNLGYAGGNNVGLHEVLRRGSEFAWILNPDTIVEAGTLPRLTAHMRAEPDCGIVGPRVVFPDGRIWSDGGVVDPERHGATYHRAAGKPAHKVADSNPVVVDYVPGASVLVRRSLMQSVGLLPEEYFLYYEEAEWCWRAASAGWRVMIEPKARMVHHKRSGTAIPTPYYLYYMTRNRYRFAAQVLGRDGEAAWADMEEAFHRPLRANVERLAPEWLTTFDDLVKRAKDDARAGRYGRNDNILSTPVAQPESH